LVVAAGGDHGQIGAAREALAEAEHVGDAFAVAHAATGLFLALVGNRHLNAALAVVERALSMLGDDLHTTDQRLLLLQNRMAILGNLDRLAEAGAAVRELVAAAGRYASPHRQLTVQAGAALHHYEVGRWDEALAELETLAQSGVPVPPNWELTLHGVSIQVWLILGVSA